MVFCLSHVAPDVPAWDGAMVREPVDQEGMPRQGVVCWNDGEPLLAGEKAVQLPERWVCQGDDQQPKFSGDTCFCSWECAVAWAGARMAPLEFKTLRTKVFAHTERHVRPAPDVFRCLAKYIGPEGWTVEQYRDHIKNGSDDMELSVATPSIVPGHSVSFWTAAVKPLTGPRITTPASFGMGLHSLANLPPIPPIPPPLPPAHGERVPLRRQRPSTGGASHANTLMQFVKPPPPPHANE